VAEPLKTPRGTRDLLPPETRLWASTEAAFRRVFEAYGYGEIRTPIFEATELFVRGIGEHTDIVGKEMYSFKDRKDRSLTLRPEGTAPVVRAYLEHALGKGESGEAKLYYIGPMFRYERPQAGRYRQFFQAGVEAIGFDDPLADAECIAMLVAALKEAGLEGLSVDVNSIGCHECRPPYLEMLKAHLRQHLASLSEESKLRLELNPLRVMDSKDPKDAEAVDSAPKVTNHLCSACSAHFAALLRHLERAGVEHQVNKKLVRGFDYYTRTAFEVLSADLGAQSAVAGGGRYDHLVEQFSGSARPAVGFGVGLDRLIMLLQKKQGEAPAEAAVDVALVTLGAGSHGPAFALMQELRGLGLSAWMDLSRKRGMKNQMKTAAAMRARFALILGEDELAKGEISAKDMLSGEQSPLPLKGAAAAIKEKLK
jgi:histidyl-tRNA synthetase